MRLTTTISAAAIISVLALTGCSAQDADPAGTPGPSTSAPAEPTENPDAGSAEIADVDRIVEESIDAVLTGGVTFTPVEGGNGKATIVYDPARPDVLGIGYLDGTNDSVPVADEYELLQLVQFGRIAEALDGDGEVVAETLADDADAVVVLVTLPDTAKFTFTVSKATGLPTQVFVQEAGQDWGVDLDVEFSVTEAGARILDAVA